MRKLTTLVIGVFFVHLANGQDVKADFKKINGHYYNTGKLAMDVTYELYLDSSPKASEIEKGTYKRSGNDYYLKQSDQEVMINEKYVIVADAENKVIAVDRFDKNTSNIDPMKLPLDSLFRIYSKIEFYKTGKNGELNAYHFEIKNGMYSSVDVIFNPKTFFVEEIVNVYREKVPDENNILHKAVLKTSFTNINASPAFKNDFSEYRYLEKKNGKWALNNNYKTYKLINHL
jgi:hypothetical protein